MTQRELVLSYIRKHGSITPFEAFSYLGITKLATVVSDMRLKEGIEFDKELVHDTNRFGKKTQYMRYRLKEG